MLDLDHFKDVNDSYGHQVGDELLLRFAQLCKENFRRGHDVVCRFGGDEFLILLPETSLQDAQQAVTRLKQSLETLSLEDVAPKMGQILFSAGIVEAAGAGLSAEELCARVDGLLYEGKRAGRGRICSSRFHLEAPENEA